MAKKTSKKTAKKPGAAGQVARNPYYDTESIGHPAVIPEDKLRALRNAADYWKGYKVDCTKVTRVTVAEPGWKYE